MSKKNQSWKPFDISKISAETPITIRSKDQKETVVVLTQHGQLLEAEKRRLIEWKPEEYLVDDPEPKA